MPVDDDFLAFKAAKEAFVSDLGGTTKGEICLGVRRRDRKTSSSENWRNTTVLNVSYLINQSPCDERLLSVLRSFRYVERRPCVWASVRQRAPCATGSRVAGEGYPPVLGPCFEDHSGLSNTRHNRLRVVSGGFGLFITPRLRLK